MPEHENKSPDPPGPSPTTKTTRKPKKNRLLGAKIALQARKIEAEHAHPTPEHANSILEHENGSPEPPAPSPTTKNFENGPKIQKNRKNRKFEVGGTRPEAYLNTRLAVWKYMVPEAGAGYLAPGYPALGYSAPRKCFEFVPRVSTASVCRFQDIQSTFNIRSGK